MRTVDIDTLRRWLDVLPVDNPRVVMGGNHSVPRSLLQAMDATLPSFRLFMLNAPHGVPAREGVTLETPFVGPGMRGQPTLSYFPCRLSLVPALIRQQAPPDVVAVQVAPPRDGMLSLGAEVNILPAAIETALARGAPVIAEINPRMPYTSGDALLPVEHVDLAVEVDEPLGELPRPAASDVQRLIGENVAALVADQATLQLGIGAIPDAVLGSLHKRRGLRVWSEMISDGVFELERAGALGPDAVTTSFAAGTEEFYAWLHDNPRVTFCRTERSNDPAVIARQPAMTSINAALQVDLFAQANASYVRGRIHSGFGGQSDFVVGALHSPSGHAIIALPSWHQASSSSTIVDRLPAPATSFQHSYVVTEQGVATIWGRPQREQAAELIRHAAHPEARDGLSAQATSLFGGTVAAGRTG